MVEKTFDWANWWRVFYLDNALFKPSKIYSKENPSKDDFVIDNVKCYIIAILYDVQCFSLKNFSPDGPAAISFLIALDMGYIKNAVVRAFALSGPPYCPVNPSLDLYIKQAHHCISPY